jgi:PAS domain S-box-containing protein
MAPASDSERHVPLPGVSREWLRILELNPDGVLVLGADARVLYANRAATALLARDGESLVGRSVDSIAWHAPARARAAEGTRPSPFRDVLRTGEPVQDVEVGVRRRGRRLILSVNAAPLAAAAGETGVIGSIRDVTAHRRADLHERLLAESGRVIAGALDSDTMLRSLATVAVPAFADVCVLELPDATGARRFSVTSDAAGQLRYDAAPAVIDLSPLSAAVIVSRAPVHIPELTEDAYSELVRDPRHIEELKQASAKSLLCVPLIARGHVEGAVTLISAGDVFEGEDREFAQQLADRAALALSNGRLFRTAQEATAEAAAQHARAREILESITDAFWALDRDWRFTYVNHHAEKVLGTKREDLIGRRIWDAFPDGIGTRAYGEMQKALLEQQPRVFEIESPVLDTWLEVHVYPSDRGLSVYLHDITTRKEFEFAQRLLVDTGISLSSTLELEETLRRAARVAIPELADLCTIDLVESGADTLRRAAAAASDEASAEALNRLGRRHPPDWRLPSSAMDAFRTGEPILVPDLADTGMVGALPDPELLHLAQDLGARSALVVPLMGHERSVGVMTFAFARSGRRYSPGHLRLAAELARRIAFAIDNARLYEEAQESNRAKSNFISVISHEFRTPLTAIVGYAELMADGLSGPVTQKQEEQLARIKSSAWHLTRLVDEILTFSRMDAGRENVEDEPVDLIDVANRAATLIEPVAATKQLALRVELPAERIITRSDTGKVSQILINLLSNAVKFTDEGEVLLRLYTLGRRHIFEVSDTGIGIDAENRQRVFDSFWQVDQGPTRRVGGTGLGLTIARRLARLLGGDVDLVSTPGEGSTFSVWLPAHEPTFRAREALQPEAAAG